MLKAVVQDGHRGPLPRGPGDTLDLGPVDHHGYARIPDLVEEDLVRAITPGNERGPVSHRDEAGGEP
jgi:hypothetical protein